MWEWVCGTKRVDGEEGEQRNDKTEGNKCHVNIMLLHGDKLNIKIEGKWRENANIN